MRFGALAWRGLAGRPLRTGLTAIGIGLGVAVVAATLIADRAASETVGRAARDLMGEADLRVRAFRDEGFTPRAVATLRGLPGVEAAAPVAEQRLTYYSAGRDEQVFSAVLTLGVDPSAEQAVRDWRLEEGRFVAAAGEAVVGAEWARDHGLAVGGELRFDALEDRRSLEIVGLLASTGMGAMARGEVVVLSRDTLNDAFLVAAPVMRVDLAIEPGALGQVEAALDADLTEPFVVENLTEVTAELARAQASFAPVGLLFGTVGLAVGAFLVFNALAMTLAERSRELGLLRAAGTTSRQVLGLFLRQGVAIGLIGGVVGVVLGIGMAVAAVAFLRATRQVLADGVPVSVPTLVVAAGLGVAVAVAGSVIPAVQAARLSPLDALRPSRQPGRTLWGRLRWLIGVELAVVLAGLAAVGFGGGGQLVGTLALGLGILLGGAVATAFLLIPVSWLVGRPFEWFFGAEGLLGRANLGRDHARSGLTVAALVISLAAVVALGAVAESARVTAQRWVVSILPGGYAIRTAVDLPIDEYRESFESVPETRSASPIVEFAAVLAAGERRLEVSMAGIDPSLFQDSGALLITDGERASAFQALRDRRAVLVPEPFAAHHRLEVGDRLLIGAPGAAAAELEVAGVVRYSLPGRGGDGALLVSLADARERFGEDEASLWAMVPHPGVAPSVYHAAIADAAQRLAGAPVTAEQLAGELGRSLDRLIGLFDLLAIVTVVIAGLGVVNTLAMGVVERAREISVLRAHGMTVGQVQATVVAEAAIMGTVGGLIALAIGIGVAWTAVGAGPSEFAGGLALPWLSLLAVVLLGIGVATLAAIYPARLAARQPIVRPGFE